MNDEIPVMRATICIVWYERQSALMRSHIWKRLLRHCLRYM